MNGQNVRKPDPEEQGAAAARPPLAGFDDAALAAGERLFRLPCQFVKGVVDGPGLPPGDRAEAAFAGRSNVGKSSLLNALAGRRTLARTSNTPGRTRELNFFDLGGLAWLVDMPGYGYAQAPKTQVAGWTRLIHDYLKGRPGLRRVFLLIDSRHGPKPSDQAIMKVMDEAAVTFQVVLTKIDKLKAAELAAIVARTAAVLADHPAAFPGLIATSAAKGGGIAELRAAVAEACEK